MIIWETQLMIVSSRDLLLYVNNYLVTVLREWPFNIGRVSETLGRWLKKITIPHLCIYTQIQLFHEDSLFIIFIKNVSPLMHEKKINPSFRVWKKFNYPYPLSPKKIYPSPPKKKSWPPPVLNGCSLRPFIVILW